MPLLLVSACTHSVVAYRLLYPDQLVRDGFSSPVLSATIEGKPVRLLVDTGAGVHTLARWFAATAALQSTPASSTAIDSTGRELPIELVRATLQVDGHDHFISLIVVDFPPVFERHQIAGLVSPQLLAPAGEAAVLDERAGTLQFESFDAAVRRTGAVELPAARVCDQGNLKPNRLYAVPVTIAGDTVMLELDSGANQTTLRTASTVVGALAHREVRGHTMGVAGQAVNIEQGIADVTFGGATTRMAVQIVPGQVGGCEGDGLLAQDVLARCILILGETRLAASCRPP